MPNETVDTPAPGNATARTNEPTMMAATLLPEGARLLHVGQPGRAVRDIRAAASAHRELLREHGVVYPGEHLDQSEATSTLIGPRSPAWRATRTLAEWDALRTEIEAHPKMRAIISDEHIAGCDDETAQRFVDELRSRLHVVITARSLGSLLPAIWQRHLLNGARAGYGKWLARALAPERRNDAAGGIPGEYDLETQVVRWTRLIGPARVHVVLVDDGDSTVAAGALETMLGLPAGMLAHEEIVAGDEGRDLSSIEANVLRRLNSELKQAAGMRAEDHRVVRGAAIDALRGRRHPSEREGRLGVPPKYAAPLAAEAKAFVDAAVATGIDVAGAVPHFLAQPTAPSAPRASVEDRVDIVTSMLRGAMSAVLDRGVDFEQPVPERHPLAGEAPTPRRGRDVLHVDLSSRRVIDCIQSASADRAQPALIGGVARVVASSRTARWVGVEGYAIADPDLRERIFDALNDPKVVITVDSGAERALWEQALALGETRDFADWSIDGDALLAAIADHAEDVSIIRAEDDDAIRQAIQDHPAPLQWNPSASRRLNGPDVQIIRDLNASLADVDLQPFERLTVIGAGAMGGMRARRSRDKNRADSMARAIVGIASIAAQHSVGHADG